MSTTEDKRDLLLTEVRSLQAEQLKLLTTVNSNTWSIDADKFFAEHSNSVKDLGSRIEVLEAATTTALPLSPVVRESGRANGHHIVPHYQGAHERNSYLHHTLVKGESQRHVLHIAVVNEPESSDRKQSMEKSKLLPSTIAKVWITP
jgi:hypothetical protein